MNANKIPTSACNGVGFNANNSTVKKPAENPSTAAHQSSLFDLPGIPLPPGAEARAALDLPWPGRVIIGFHGEPVRCSSAPRVLSLDPDARRILLALRGNLEPRLAEGADLAAVSGFTSKLPGACARIAMAFTILRDPQAETVGAEAMRAACAWALFLVAHHRAVLGDAAERPETHHARRLWRALKRRGRATMTGRDLFRLVHDSALPDMDAFSPVLAILVEHGAVRPIPGEKGKAGRHAAMYEVHPDLLPTGIVSDLSDNSQDMAPPRPGVSSDLSDKLMGNQGAA